ncbi:Hsp20/alpha crystallin family protein [Flavobacterium sp. MXW15]|uniref:Hsp20/alpha crystallin family protein n=1 Tax=Xanthomonas chitinilytica TaxID=2989819 RepID=A0ABT3JVC5_9XANT|nr:Hsp20/alpha crystallin family protein [Xanthomonas sp. H13-6]MCW4454940.1 Hsp20/alpha crystallin family protein [Flavobacterium sp. MXW15]MCW4472433.1 Hsp20/alpha crystallin family protein [Xanthomonas sp. H13-6]
MSIVRYRQWPAQAAFQNEIRQLFGALLDNDGQAATDDSAVVTAQWVPAVDIREEAGQFVLYADLPGIDPAQIEVQMDKGILSIKGERRLENAPEGERFSRVERRHGSFHRRFALPDSADPEGISASGNNGVLEIRIPKRAEVTPRRIQVETGSRTAQ